MASKQQQPLVGSTTTTTTSSTMMPIASTTSPSTTDATTTTTTTTTNRLPFYRSGGMMINLIGIVINLIIPLVIMCQVPNNAIQTHTQSMLFLKVLIGAWIFAFITTTRSKTTYCIFVVPTYFVSFLVLPMILQQELSTSTVDVTTTTSTSTYYYYYEGVKIVLIAAIVASMKINICMSVCMHRYAAHAAFKCGYYTNIALCFLGCLANQGGPLWWASQHRCHHKFCELPRDPHSPKQTGTERAFGFFLERYNVEEEFVPQHLQFVGLRLLDTWAFLVVSFELWFAYTFLGGNVALFIAFTSGWISQTISLWFNVANHPIVKTTTPVSVDPQVKSSTTTKIASTKLQSECTASDDQATMEPGLLYIPFYIFDAVVPIFSWLAMEDQHEHHHNHGNLAKRSPHDVAYWTFIKPLEMMGLVWNVVVK